MATALFLFKFVIMALTVAPGTALNSLIITVYYEDWRRRQLLRPCYQIFLSTALCNLTLQWTPAIICVTCYFFVDQPYIILVLHYAYVFTMVLTYFNFWNTAWLSSYYCLKLVNCSHRYLTWLKSRMSSSMGQIIGISLVGVILVTLPLLCMVELIPNHNLTKGSQTFTLNMKSHMAVNLLLGCVFPFVETLICIGLSVTSLLRHVWRIEKNRSGFSSCPQIEGHIRAVRVMMLQDSHNAAMQLSVIGLIFSSFTPGVILDGIFGVITLTNPSAEALTLITGNPKLKDRLFRALNIFCQNV